MKLHPAHLLLDARGGDNFQRAPALLLLSLDCWGRVDPEVNLMPGLNLLWDFYGPQMFSEHLKARVGLLSRKSGQVCFHSLGRAHCSGAHLGKGPSLKSFQLAPG